MDGASRLRVVMNEIRTRANSHPLIEIRDPGYPEQDRFVQDRARFLAACTTRRAGKSNGLGLRFYNTLQTHPGAFCPYIALTRESAKNIMWDVLQEQDEKFKIGAKFTLSNLTVTVPRWKDARIQLFGADMKNFIKRLRGIKSPGVGIDEAQDFGSHLESLVDDVVTPATSDYSDGWVGMTGTPGPIPHGYFYEVTELKKFGYSRHAWSLYDNPYLPDPRGFVQDLMRKKGWTPDHPTFLREYCGRWVKDLQALVFKYSEDKNHYDRIQWPRGQKEAVIGIDLGFDDADAIAVIGWNDRANDSFLLREEVNRGDGITELVDRINQVISKLEEDDFHILKIVVDTAGLGKKITEEIRRRYQIPLVAAEKARMYEYIEILNDALRQGRFKARADSLFAHDCNRLKWDTESVKPKISDVFHSDICMAVLYAYREALHWLHEPEPVRPEPGTPEHFQAQEEDMEALAEAQYGKSNSGDPWSEEEWKTFG